ncbi:major facilitator superfamily domain-containing protein [Bombardia bombarda]|uniref:Major facilitator superfamily domain-containing protein n=1 Tax=Bombardia bombarda TaxID=252184 RepID=A0AA39WBJ9_9PEZI|nr:major facilitator superfamily domain-containing protein [Bombardia bombarda]
MTLPADISAVDDDVEVATPDVAKLEQGGIPEQAEWKPGRSEYAVMGTLAVISLMVALDATILVSVLPTLAIDFGGTTTDAFWAGTSYLLSCAVCQPFIAALSDIFGRKEMLIVSVLFFTIGTILCAPVAKNFAVFFAGRSVQGIGGGGIITMGQVIFADIVPLRQRPKYFSIVLGAWALGSVLGPLIGGLFVEHAHWSWCFYLNLPFCAFGLVLVPIFVKLTTEKTSLVSKLARVDWVGGFLFIGSLTGFLVGISWAGVQFPWNSAQVIAPLTVGALGVVASIFWEVYYAKEPFLRGSLFYSWSAIAAYACALFQGLILFCALYYVPFYFTAVRFSSPTTAGLNIFPVTCFLLPGSILISLLTSRFGKFRWAVWSGWILAAVSCGFFRFFDQHTKTVVWAVILAIFGIGHGMLLTSINVGIQAISHVEDAGRAAAMYAFMRTLGMSIGVAIGGTVFQNLMGAELRVLGLPEAISHNSEAFVATMLAMDPTDPVRIGVLQAYVKGFQGVYWTITGAAVVAFVISLTIKRHSLDKILASKFVLRGSKIIAVNGQQLRPVAISTGIDAVPPNRQLPGLLKDSPGSTLGVPPGSDSESISSDSKSKQQEEGSTEMVPNEKPLASDSQQPTDSALKSTPKAKPRIALAVAVAVAYYVEPGGRQVPIDILSDDNADVPELEPSQPAVYKETLGNETASIHDSLSSENDEPELLTARESLSAQSIPESLPEIITPAPLFERAELELLSKTAEQESSTGSS